MSRAHIGETDCRHIGSASFSTREVPTCFLRPAPVREVSIDASYLKNITHQCLSPHLLHRVKRKERRKNAANTLYAFQKPGCRLAFVRKRDMSSYELRAKFMTFTCVTARGDAVRQRSLCEINLSIGPATLVWPDSHRIAAFRRKQRAH